MQYSIIVNPNHAFKCQSPVNDTNLEESDLNVTKTDPLQELSQDGPRNPTKDFIVRMTPMMQKRKAIGNSYYRNAIMKAAGVKENGHEQQEDQGSMSSSSKNKILASPFSSSKNSDSNNQETLSYGSKLRTKSRLREDAALILRYSSQERTGPN
jgi:hypothetical protein